VRGKGGIDERLDRRCRAEARGELEATRAGGGAALGGVERDADVGTAKTVDRLLRVADQEELTRCGLDAAPVARGGIVGGEQQQDLRLERIGVLELVDEQMRAA